MFVSRLQGGLALLAVAMTATAAIADERVWTGLPADQRATIQAYAFDDSSGRFEAVRIGVRDGNARIDSVKLTFGNGKTRRFELNERIKAGRITSTIDLPRDRVRIVAAEIAYRGAGIPFVQGAIASDRDGFDVLDTVRLDTRDDFVRFNLGRGAQRTGALRMRARYGDIVIRRAEVVFGNGRSQTFRIRERLRAGDAVDLDVKGDRRRVREVNVVLRPQKGTAKPVRLDLLGLEGRDGDGRRETDYETRRPNARGGEWDLLGARRAALFGKDSDVILVGKDKGRFDSIRLRAVDQDVRMYGMQITYGNGSVEDVPLYGTLREGRTSQVFDLKGRDRFIKHIAFRYRSKLSLKGPARVELWARRAR